MAIKHIHAKALARLLNASAQPIYVLDDELTIVFLNQECRNWLGANCRSTAWNKMPLSHALPIIGTAETVAAGLCPPPGDCQVKKYRPRFLITVKTVNCGSGVRGFIPLGSPPGDVIGSDRGCRLRRSAGQDFSALDVESTDELQGCGIARGDSSFSARGGWTFSEPIGWWATVRPCSLPGVKSSWRLAIDRAYYWSVRQAADASIWPRSSIMQALGILRATSPAGGLIPLDCSVLAADLILSTIAALARSNPSGEKIRRTTLLLNHVDEIPTELQMELAILFTKKPFPLRLISTARIALTELCCPGAISRRSGRLFKHDNDRFAAACAAARRSSAFGPSFFGRMQCKASQTSGRFHAGSD